MKKKTKKATFAGGCFWCQDAVFRTLKGVQSVQSGYSGGDTEYPSYEDVSAGLTDHLEAVQIEYNPNEITYDELLKVFWSSHNPDQVGGQGSDLGSQYEAAIFYHNEKQKKLAEESREMLDGAGIYDGPIVTKIIPYENFYPAEDYHQDYYKKNPFAPYCRVVVDPKVEKVKKLFKNKIKP